MLVYSALHVMNLSGVQCEPCAATCFTLHDHDWSLDLAACAMAREGKCCQSGLRRQFEHHACPDEGSLIKCGNMCTAGIDGIDARA
jgi:hypothetical protein